MPTPINNPSSHPSKYPSNKPARPKKPKAPNLIATAVAQWLADPDVQSRLAAASIGQAALAASAPKRWVIYEPMVLLPSGSFASDEWTRLLGIDEANVLLPSLWCCLLAALSPPPPRPALTHLAVNDGIPPDLPGRSGLSPEENVLRSPTGLRILHGDFGPPRPSDPAMAGDDDFARAFWVSTRQNGIYQTWAPRWTMFSRGNVKEKTRVLAFPAATDRGVWAVDLYAGIGYFVFSYASLGLRVLCWELNPWSVEGLRRGAVANGWAVHVVRSLEDLARPTPDLITAPAVGSEPQIVVFLESNAAAPRRLRELRAATPLHVAHVNCGFLPTSQPSWAAAVDAAGHTSTCRLHLHENVARDDIASRAAEARAIVQDLAGPCRLVVLEHTELVKTFAPEVLHCVFDLCLQSPPEEDGGGKAVACSTS